MNKPIPLYGSDGTPWGFRTLKAAQRLVANGIVSPAYGRKGHLKAIFSKKADGSSAVTVQVQTGTRYSFRERIAGGKTAWTLKRLGKGSELRPIFLAVVTDCVARP